MGRDASRASQDHTVKPLTSPASNDMAFITHHWRVEKKFQKKDTQRSEFVDEFSEVKLVIGPPADFAPLPLPPPLAPPGNNAAAAHKEASAAGIASPEQVAAREPDAEPVPGVVQPLSFAESEALHVRADRLHMAWMSFQRSHERDAADMTNSHAAAAAQDCHARPPDVADADAEASSGKATDKAGRAAGDGTLPAAGFRKCR